MLFHNPLKINPFDRYFLPIGINFHMGSNSLLNCILIEHVSLNSNLFIEESKVQIHWEIMLQAWLISDLMVSFQREKREK